MIEVSRSPVRKNNFVDSQVEQFQNVESIHSSPNYNNNHHNKTPKQQQNQYMNRNRVIGAESSIIFTQSEYQQQAQQNTLNIHPVSADNSYYRERQNESNSQKEIQRNPYNTEGPNIIEQEQQPLQPIEADSSGSIAFTRVPIKDESKIQRVILNGGELQFKHTLKSTESPKSGSFSSNPQIIIPFESDDDDDDGSSQSEEESKLPSRDFTRANEMQFNNIRGTSTEGVASSAAKMPSNQRILPPSASFFKANDSSANNNNNNVSGYFQQQEGQQVDLASGLGGPIGIKQTLNKLSAKNNFETEVDSHSINTHHSSFGQKADQMLPFDPKKFENFISPQKEQKDAMSAAQIGGVDQIEEEQNQRDEEKAMHTDFSDHQNQSINLYLKQVATPDRIENRLSDAPMLRNKQQSSEKEIDIMESNHIEQVEMYIDDGKDHRSLIPEEEEEENESVWSNGKKKKRGKGKMSPEKQQKKLENDIVDQLDDSLPIGNFQDNRNLEFDKEGNILLMRDNGQHDAAASEVNKLNKHIGKDINLQSQQLQKNQLQMERSIAMKQSESQIKGQVQQLNKLELEEKKERQIQKFCRKFFKDQLKNRSGVPTLTQNNRTMNLDSETPNPGFRTGLTLKKDGLLNDELRKELFNIEEHQKYRLVMDQFLKKFSRSPKEAIQFLIDKQLCDDREEDIAYMILTTEGLNKEQLGVFFGSSKEKNQAILEAFCSLMDFRNLRFDEALRLFLSRFRIPGESQQIDRIIQKFTKVYMNDNVDVFKDEDTPYILCYSAIMLNVDAHSEKIEKKNKMTKVTFVKNNLSCTRNAVSAEFLEMLYDNIVKDKIETKVDYIEKIYSRVPIESMTKQFDGQHRMRITKALQIGAIFFKYGRKGKPHMRKVWLSEGKDKIVWMEVDSNQAEPHPGIIQPQKKSNPINAVTAAAEKQLKERNIYLKDVTDLALGSNTTAVMQRNNVPTEFDQFCFSIITTERTLDLKASDMDSKFQWIAFIYNHLNDLRVARKNKLTQMNAARNSNNDRISEIWRMDIFSKWDDHWDYGNSKPKYIAKFESKSNAKPSIFSQICSCMTPFRGANGGVYKSPIKNKNNQNSGNKSYNQVNASMNSNRLNSPHSNRDYEELDLVNHSNKSLLLITLWKLGMPKWVRKTIWPLTIGNRLEITENLYSILLKQVRLSSSSSDTIINSNQIIGASIQKMQDDLKRMKTKILHASLSKAQEKMVENVLSAFIFYRPDIGYIQEAMPNLVAVLIHHIEDEFTIFKCFINLLHSHHFLTFFRGEMSEIKWRVQFFNEHLQNRLPLVLQHFRALDLSSELFIMPWFLNLFSNIFDLETVFRIWDNFLLEGELFAFKAGIAFVEYFHLEFKMATFDDAFTLLKNPPEDIFCEDLYFDIIQDIKIPLKDFTDRIDQQNVAKLAPQILQQLL